MKRLEEMHMLAEALDKRTSSHQHTFDYTDPHRWHGTCCVYTGGQGPNRKSLGP